MSNKPKETVDEKVQYWNKITDFLAKISEIFKKCVEVLLGNQQNKQDGEVDKNINYDVFWNPDTVQIKVLEKMTKKSREKMQDFGLTYSNKVDWGWTITIKIDRETIVFPREQPKIGVITWNKYMEISEKSEWVIRVEEPTFRKMKENLGMDVEALWIDPYVYYWLPTEDAENTNKALCGSFFEDSDEVMSDPRKPYILRYFKSCTKTNTKNTIFRYK
jgi:hypothetical protein